MPHKIPTWTSSTTRSFWSLSREETSRQNERQLQGPGEHSFDHRGDLVLPEVAYGTPAARRDALLKRIIEKRLWVHFIRPTVVDAFRRRSTPTASMGSKTVSAMLPIGVVVLFQIFRAQRGDLASILDRYDESDNEKLASALGMSAKVVEGLVPSIFQVNAILSSSLLLIPF